MFYQEIIFENICFIKNKKINSIAMHKTMESCYKIYLKNIQEVMKEKKHFQKNHIMHHLQPMVLNRGYMILIKISSPLEKKNEFKRCHDHE